jgi:carbon-monoxide dehydrogenase medium subunit
MYSFTFERPQTLRQAVNLLSKNADAKLLAGGHTLLPTMKLRLANPPVLIDMSRIEGLTGIELTGRAVTIGALTRHNDVHTSPVVQQSLPVLAKLAGLIGDPAVRHMGTIGGSVANNDPNADYPAACLGLGATIITNKRRIVADEFFTGMFSTALEPTEIITKVSFPIPKKAAYQKFRNQASRYALVGVFVGKRSSEIRVAVTGAGANGVFRVPSFEEALKKRFSPKSLEGLTIPADGLNSDIHGSAEYRAHLVGVLARRAVAEAVASSSVIEKSRRRGLKRGALNRGVISRTKAAERAHELPSNCLAALPRACPAIEARASNLLPGIFVFTYNQICCRRQPIAADELDPRLDGSDDR